MLEKVISNVMLVKNGLIEVEIMQGCSCRAEWKTTCPQCQGEGKEKGYICTLCGGKKIICKECNGSGKIHGSETTEMYCDVCDGFGKMSCSSCNGRVTMSKIIYSKITFEKIESRLEDYKFYLPNGNMKSIFNKLNPIYLDELYRGKIHLIRFISREELNIIQNYEIEGENFFNTINDLISNSGPREENYSY